MDLFLWDYFYGTMIIDGLFLWDYFYGIMCDGLIFMGLFEWDF